MPDTKSIVIAGASVAIPIRYAAGHTLSENEAKGLNQLLFENVRNNTAKKVKEVVGDSVEITPEQQEKINAIVLPYAEAYDFSGVRTGSGEPAKTPLEAETLRVAKEVLSLNLKKQGITAKAYGEEKVKETLERYCSADKVISIAKQRLAATQKSLESALAAVGDLTASNPDAEEGENSAAA
jgi:hypothetical protein